MAWPTNAIDTITALLVDDEQLAREELGYLLSSFPGIKVLGEAVDGPEALQQITTLQPDIVFLDVDMPGLSGLQVVRKLLSSGSRLPHIIFATAYDQYAVEAFEVNAVDYLLKPIDKERLELSIQRARGLIRLPADNSNRMEELLSNFLDQTVVNTRLLVSFEGRMVLVNASDVIFASVKDGVVQIVATDLEGQSNYKALDDLQTTLTAPHFWRVHRSYLVNIDHIKEVVPWFRSSYQLRMSDRNQTEIPVSRAQTKQLRKLFQL